MESTSFTLLEYFRLGGPVMWPLLVYSIAVIAIAMERVIHFVYYNLEIDDLKEKTEEFIREKKFKEAEVYLEGLTKRRIGARILLVLVQRAGANEKISEYRLEKSVETEAIACVSSLENGFNFLTALGSLSPLTGFLGTVTGMIGAFRAIAEAVDVNAQIVANGIYEALITTVFGLVIAIIAMIAHSLFSYVVDKFAANVEKACSDLIIVLDIEETWK